MATNYTLGEAARIFSEGKDWESIADIGKRFPLASKLISSVTANNNDDFLTLMDFIPDYISVNKVNKAMKTQLIEGETEEKPEKKKDDAIMPKPIGKRRGRPPKAKATEEKPAEQEETDNVESDEYEGRTAMELYKECKKRGIKAEAKQVAKYYADLLRENDTESEDDTDDVDDWDDVDDEEKSDNEPVEAEEDDDEEISESESEPDNDEEDEDDDDDCWDI